MHSISVGAIFEYKIQRTENMEILKNEKGFKIEFNGSKTYFVVDSTNQVWYMVDTLKKANNRFNSILKSAGLA